MSRTITPKYRVEYADNVGTVIKSMAWDWKRFKASDVAALEEWRNVYNTSFELGGVNAHISEGLGFVYRIGCADLVNQTTGEVVAEYDPPKYEIV